MPYTKLSQLPQTVRDSLPGAAQQIFLSAYNSAYEKYKEDGRAIKIAWATVKKAGFRPPKGEEIKWQKIERVSKCVNYKKDGKPLSGGLINDLITYQPKILFVGSSGNSVDVVRGEPLSGECRKLLKSHYLLPLGIKFDDIAIVNIVPYYLVNDIFKAREPSDAELSDHIEDAVNLVLEINPDHIIALGKTAYCGLNDYFRLKFVDMWLPHPTILKKYKSTEEIERKIRSFRKKSLTKGIEYDKIPPQADELVPRKIYKADEDKQLAACVVLEPNTVDAHNDTISKEEIEIAAHKYLENHRVIGNQHKSKANASPVESYIAPVDININNQTIRQGSWVVVIKVHDDDMWAKIKQGEYTGVSIGGQGRRQAKNL